MAENSLSTSAVCTGTVIAREATLPSCGATVQLLPLTRNFKVSMNLLSYRKVKHWHISARSNIDMIRNTTLSWIIEILKWFDFIPILIGYEIQPFYNFSIFHKYKSITWNSSLSNSASNPCHSASSAHLSSCPKRSACCSSSSSPYVGSQAFLWACWRSRILKTSSRSTSGKHSSSLSCRLDINGSSICSWKRCPINDFLYKLDHSVVSNSPSSIGVWVNKLLWHDSCHYVTIAYSLVLQSAKLYLFHPPDVFSHPTSPRWMPFVERRPCLSLPAILADLPWSGWDWCVTARHSYTVSWS